MMQHSRSAYPLQHLQAAVLGCHLIFAAVSCQGLLTQLVQLAQQRLNLQSSQTHLQCTKCGTHPTSDCWCTTASMQGASQSIQPNLGPSMLQQVMSSTTNEAAGRALQRSRLPGCVASLDNLHKACCTPHITAMGLTPGRADLCPGCVAPGLPSSRRWCVQGSAAVSPPVLQTPASPA